MDTTTIRVIAGVLAVIVPGDNYLATQEKNDRVNGIGLAATVAGEGKVTHVQQWTKSSIVVRLQQDARNVRGHRNDARGQLYSPSCWTVG